MSQPLRPHDGRREAEAFTVGRVDHPRRHDADGRVFVAYFRADKILGFAWDANIEHTVQVTREVGEPVFDTFELGLPARLETHHLFHLFQQACDRYADTFKPEEY